jgi:hypothetical protein
MGVWWHVGSTLQCFDLRIFTPYLYTSNTAGKYHLKITASLYYAAPSQSAVTGLNFCHEKFGDPRLNTNKFAYTTGEVVDRHMDCGEEGGEVDM